MNVKNLRHDLRNPSRQSSSPPSPARRAVYDVSVTDYSLQPRRRSLGSRVLLGIVVLIIVGALVALIRHVVGPGLPQTHIASRRTYDAPPSNFNAAEDWPRWRGPRGDAISRETGIPDTFPSGGPPQLWAADVGVGYSSPVARAGRVYLFTLNDRQEVLTCFDGNSGNILWSDALKDSMWAGSYPGTRATPTIDGDAIYTYGGAGQLVCRDLETGSPRWVLNVLKTTGSRNLQWGTASTPLVVGDTVVVQSGKDSNVAVAVRKSDGSVAWKSEARGVGGYAHPILADVAGKPQLVLFAGEAVVGADPATGKTLWSEPWQTSYDVNAATPVYRDGHLMVSSEYGHGSMMLQLDANGAKKLWESTEIQSKFPNLILDGDALYANSAGTIKCMSWPDGRILWEAKDTKLRLGTGGSLLRLGDRLLALSDRGKLSLCRATRDGITLLDQADVLDARQAWSSPLLYGGRLFAKGDTEFVCVDLSGKAATTRPATQVSRG
jgi:outer membrane protein assembly factor BamB